jgi:hypothetical protein
MPAQYRVHVIEEACVQHVDLATTAFLGRGSASGVCGTRRDWLGERVEGRSTWRKRE